MKISIITPSYNSERTIKDTLVSILNQTHADVEHIVVDGLSRDETCKIVEYKSPQSILLSEKDDGLYDAMNKGIARATGEIISILNSDDMYYDENVLDTVVKEFKDSNADIVYGHIVFVDSENISKITRVWKTGPIRTLLLWLGWIMPHPAVFVRKRVYDEIDMFNTVYRKSADYDFLIRAIHSGVYTIKYLDRFLVHMRTGGMSDGTPAERIHEWKVTANIFKKYYKVYPFWIFVTRPLMKVGQFFKRREK